SDLHSGAFETNWSEHQQSFLKARVNHLKSEIGIRLFRARKHAQDARHQAFAMYVADLGKAALDVTEAPVQHRTHGARLRSEVFFYHQIDGCESRRAAHRIAGVGGGHAAYRHR